MPTASSPEPKRKHVTTACVACRESKIKCDGKSPTCANCSSKGKQCVYQAGDDKRKLTIRLAIELLSGRIEQLCRFITDNDMQPPPLEDGDRASLLRVLNHLRISPDFVVKDLVSEPEPSRKNSPSRSSENGPPTNSTSSARDEATHKDAQATQPSAGEYPDWQHGTDETSSLPALLDSTDAPDASSQSATLGSTGQMEPDAPFLEAMMQSDWPWDENANPGAVNQLPFAMGAGATHSQAFVPSPTQFGRRPGSLHTLDFPVDSNRETQESDSTETLIDQLSDRIGSLQIGPGGQVRYYGPTSNFNLVEMPAPDNLTVHRTVRNDGQEHLECLGLGKVVPLELEKHLTNLYFAWQDPSFHVVNRAMFESARAVWREKKEDTVYFSESLQNSICSLGAAFETKHHPTFVTFPKSLSDFFADRAKALLEIELDSPCVATVQAMVVLSSHDIGCKRDARGWLYSGMAMRLAFDLALHVDLTTYVAKGRLSQAEADLRRDVFWGAYTIDHIWGFYLGRPFRINMEDVTAAKPGGRTTAEPTNKWIPYTSPTSAMECTPLQDYTEELHKQRVQMVEVMAPLGYALYGSLRIPSTALQKMNAKIVAELLEWKANLPPILHVDLDDRQTPYLPHVILLHMQYHQNIIHAHRPWMSRTYTQPSPPQGPGAGHARMMCIESAYSIAKLLQLYEIRYPLRRMNIQGVGVTCSAALLLIFATVSHYQHQDANDVGLHLSACFRALDEFSVSWESAKRAREFLVLLQRQWERQGRATRVRRASQSVPAGSAPRKRNRTESFEGVPDQSMLQGGISPSQTLNVDTDMGFDLDWIFAGDAPSIPQGSRP